MNSTSLYRQSWRLTPFKNEGQEKYRQTLKEITCLLSKEAVADKLFQQAITEAKQCLYNESKDYSKLIGGFELWLEDHCSQDVLTAYLTASLIKALLQDDFVALMPKFLALKSHSASLGNCWVDAVIIVAKYNSNFSCFLINLAQQKITELDKSITKRQPVEMQLSWIWRQYYDLHNDLVNPFSDWPWFDLLWQLEPTIFSKLLAECKSPYTVSGILIWARLTDNFNFWRLAIDKAPIAFTKTGEWNGSLLLPMLLAEANQNLLQSVSDYEELLEGLILNKNSKVERLIRDVVAAVAASANFPELIKPWAIQLFQNMDSFSDKDSTARQLHELILTALIKQPPNKQQLCASANTVFSNDWLSLSLLGWVASEYPQDFIILPNPEAFVEQWKFNHNPENSWLAVKGKKLLKSSKEFDYKKTNSPLIKYLAAYLTLNQPKKAAKHWKDMWQGTYQLRESLNFSTPDPKKYLQRSYDARGINCLLLNIGLAMLEELNDVNLQEEQQLEEVINSLFYSLWQASFTLLKLDEFNNKEIYIIQIHLLLIRAQWQLADENGNKKYELLNEKLSLTHANLLQHLKSNTINLILSLPFYKDNGISNEWLKNELIKAGLDLKELLDVTEKLVSLDSSNKVITERSLNVLRSII